MKDFWYNNIIFSLLCIFIAVLSYITIDNLFGLLSLKEIYSYDYGIYLSILFVISIFGAVTRNINERIYPFIYLYIYVILIIPIIVFFASSLQDIVKQIIYCSTFIFLFRYGFCLGYYDYEIKKKINILLIVVLPLLLYMYIKTYFYNKSEIFFISNDGIFSLIVLLPFTLLLKNKKLIYFLFSLICLCALLSLKRSAILSMLFSSAIYVYIYISRKNIFYILILLAASCGICFIYINAADVDILKLVSARFNDAGSSGRNDIYNFVYNKFIDENNFSFLYGHGFNAFSADFGMPAHNDIIELYYDFGILGVIPYSITLILLGKNCFKWYKYRSLFLENYASYVVAYISLIVLLLFNCIIYSYYNCILYLALGLNYGCIIRQLKLNIRVHN